MKKLYPVIHFFDKDLSIHNAEKAWEAGCDGVFMIDTLMAKPQSFDFTINSEFDETVIYLKTNYPDKRIGTNRLLPDPEEIIYRDILQQVDMGWEDNPGVHSQIQFNNQPFTNYVNHNLKKMWAINPDYKFFGSVAFKTQIPDPDPAFVALVAREYGWIPTTSGTKTGSPPPLDKIITMKEALEESPLAVASGMDPENIDQYLPYIDYYLVATGIASDYYNLDLGLITKMNDKIKSYK
jgi:hypothetical protein